MHKIEVTPVKKVESKFHSSVWMNIVIGGTTGGKIEIDLFKETPKCAENFRQLCTGEKGKGK